MKKIFLLMLISLSAFLMTNCDSLLNAEDANLVFTVGNGNETIYKTDLSTLVTTAIADGPNAAGNHITVDQTNKKVYMATDTGIYVTDYSGSSLTQIYTGTVNGVAFDPSSNSIYFSTAGSTTVGKIDTSGNLLQLVNVGVAVYQIALDLKNSKIYYAAGPNGILRASLSSLTTESTVTATGQPLGLALDIQNEKIYFATGLSNTIKSINFDGSNEVELLNAGGGTSGIAFDAVNKKIYYASYGGTDVYRMNTDGSGITQISNVGIAFDGVTLAAK